MLSAIHVLVAANHIPWQGGITTFGPSEPVPGAAWHTTTVNLESIMIPTAYLARDAAGRPAGSTTRPRWLYDIAVLSLRHEVPMEIIHKTPYHGSFPTLPSRSKPSLIN